MSHHPFPWREPFLQALRDWPIVQHACDAVGILRCTAYRTRQADEEFAKAWDDAMEAGVDKAEREAFRRAVEGVDKGVWHQGVQVGTERVYSDALLAKVLSARRAAYRTERTELTGADGGPVRSQQVVIATGVPTADDDIA
jgi:hypothetical protein